MGPGESFMPGADEFAPVVHQVAATVKDQVGVEDLPEAVAGAFVDADGEHHAVARRDASESLGMGSRNRDRRLEES
jgi:hypothetical protein